MKNKIILVQKFGKQYKKVDEFKYKSNDDFAKYKKHLIPIPPKNPYSFSTDKLNILFFDLHNKKYIHFETVDLGLSTSFLDGLFNRKIIQQLAKAVKQASQGEKTNFDFIKTVIIYGAVFGIGFLFGQGGF